MVVAHITLHLPPTSISFLWQPHLAPMSSTDDVHWITSVLPVISSPTSGPSSPSPSASSLDMLHTYTQPQTRPRSLSRSSSRSSFGSFYSFGHASPTLPSRPRSPPRGSSLTPDRTRVPGPTRSSSSLRTALHAATTRTRPAATRSTPALRALMAPVTSSTESLPPPTASSKLTYTHARRISLTVNPGRNLSALDSEDQATSGPTVSAFADGLASGRVPNPTQAYQVARSPSPVQNEDARSSALGSVHVIGMTRFSSGTGAGASGSSSPGSTGIGGLPYSRSTSFHATASPPPSSPRDSAQGSRYADASGNTPDSPFRRDVKTGGVISPEGTPRRSQALSHKDSFGGTGLGLGMGVPGHAVGQHPSGSSPARTHAQQDSLHLAQSGSTGSGLASAAIGNVRADLSALENSALDDADESEELDTSMRGAQTSEADPDNSFVSASVLGPAEGPSDGAATSGERERASFMPGAFVVEAAHARDDQGRSAGSQAFTPSAGASSAALPVPPDAAGPSSGLRASDTSLASASKSISASAFNTPSSSVTSIAAPTTTTPRERLGHAPSAASRGQREMRGSDRVRERTISTGGSSRATLATGNCSKLASGAVAGSIAHSRPNTACSGATVKAGNTSTSPSGGGDSSTNAAAGPSSEANAATPTPTPTAGPSTSSSSRVRNSARTTPQLPSAPNLSPAPPPAMYWSRAPVHGSVPRRAFRAHTANLADEVLWLFGGCDSKGCFRDLYCFDTGELIPSKPPHQGMSSACFLHTHDIIT